MSAQHREHHHISLVCPQKEENEIARERVWWEGFAPQERSVKGLWHSLAFYIFSEEIWLVCVCACVRVPCMRSTLQMTPLDGDGPLNFSTLMQSAVNTLNQAAEEEADYPSSMPLCPPFFPSFTLSLTLSPFFSMFVLALSALLLFGLLIVSFGFPFSP